MIYLKYFVLRGFIMNNNLTAIITDSSCDLPREYIEKNNIFVLPLKVIMPDGEYLDGVNIAPDEVYSRMPDIVPTTSQPSPNDVVEMLKRIKAEGYGHVIAVCMSSGLSGTFNVIRMCSDDVKDLKVHMFDSRRLSMALGLQVMHAAELTDKGLSAEETVDVLNESWKDSNGFYCIPTLSYLKKGGRIGLVAGTIGTVLGIVPIISINDEGKYYTYAKTRSYNLSIKKMEESVAEIVGEQTADIAVVQGGAKERAAELYDSLKGRLKNVRNMYVCHVSPALGVHTGPGLVGITYRIVK